MKRTKVVATLGPSSESEDVLAAMALAGLDVVRINTSYGTPDDHAAWIHKVRRVAEQVHKPLAVLLDTRGPKVRVAQLPSPLVLAPGQEVLLGQDIPLTRPEVLRGLRPGDRVLLADGSLELVVLGPQADGTRARVVRGGTLIAGKGVNFPGAALPLSAITEQDRVTLALARDLAVDFVALSFVQRPEEVGEAKALVGPGTAVLAKIELAYAVQRMTDIVAAADGAMVARGDLGVEIDLFQVPLVQKRLVDLCNAQAKPVIVATQMLKSMVDSPLPTRAEVADVAAAVWDGADAVMLSEETTVGRYPVEAVRTMVQAARAAESGEFPIRLPGLAPELVGEVPAAIAKAAVGIASQVKAQAIVCATVSGWTARLIAAFRPKVPIVAVTPHPAVQRKLALVWGVESALIPETADPGLLMEEGLAAARRLGAVAPGQRVVFTAGLPFCTPGTTNLIRVVEA